MARSAALIVAIICWVGLAIQFAATFDANHSIGGTLWVLARFFTILTNLAVAVAMTTIGLRGRMSPFLLGGVTLAILMVGAVYAILLAGLHELHGSALVADVVLHKLSPVAMTLWWLAFAQHRRLRWTAPAAWSLYPLAYFGYAIGRGQVDGKYPYPFMDVGQLGLAQVILNAGGIAFGLIVAGLALVLIDRRWPGAGRPT